ncbi:MAG TPA: hypothetical protein VGK73_36215 [Polyangiaceae bacterium]
MLARGRLSGAQRERALEGALRRAGGGKRRLWAALAAASALPAAAAAVFWLSAPAPGASEAASSSWLVAKGPSGPLLLATCPGRPAGECRTGDRLIFEIEGATEPGFFAAYAECASRERIWYFPTASGALPEIVPNQTRTIVGQAARIGSEHGIGGCELHLFALKQKESRPALVAGEAARFYRIDSLLEVKP